MRLTAAKRRSPSTSAMRPAVQTSRRKYWGVSKRSVYPRLSATSIRPQAAANPGAKPPGKWPPVRHPHRWPMWLLPRHRDAHRFLWRDHVCRGLSRLSERDLNPSDPTVERIPSSTVVRRDRRAGIIADIAAIIGGEDHRGCGRYLSLTDLLAIDIERCRPALPKTSAGIGKLHADLMLTGRDRGSRTRHRSAECREGCSST